MTFTEEQTRAVFSPAPTLVLACPGAGKTAVLTERAARLAGEGKRILAVTFTRKAAGELKARVLARLGKEARRVESCTLHSLALKLCLQAGEEVDLAGVEGERRAAERAARRLGLPPRRVLQVKTREKNVGGEWGRITWEYQRELEGKDFDDLLLLGLAVAKRRKEFPWDEVLVDEVQDLSPVQVELIRTIAGGRVFAVGDPDQAIYGFRGASPRLGTSLADWREVLRLSTNFRAAGKVAEVGARMASFPYRPGAPGEGVVRWWGGEGREFYLRLGEELEKAEGTAAVLCRTRAEVEEIALALSDLGVRVRQEVGEDGLPGEIRKVAAVLSAAVDPSRKEDFSLAAKTFCRFLGRSWRREVETAAREMKVPLLVAASETPFTRRWMGFHGRRLRDFLEEVRREAERDLPLAVRNVVSRLREEETSDLLLEEEDLVPLLRLAEGRTVGEFSSLLKRRNREEKEGVVVTTIHAAKGREWDHVFLPRVQEGSIPHPRGDPAEEKRVLFVGLTRARRGLTVSWEGRWSRLLESAGIPPVTTRVEERKVLFFFRRREERRFFVEEGEMAA